MSYPTTIDTLRDDFVNADPQANDHPGHHNDLADAVMAVETELGTTPSGAFTTVRERLEDIEASIGAGGNVATDIIWDAKGDLAVGSGADTADNLPVGANNKILTADSAETLGVKWADPAPPVVDNSTIEISLGVARVKASGITSNEIAADAVGSSEIAADAVGSSEIAANAVGSSELADDAVDTNAIQNGAVTDAKITGPLAANARVAVRKNTGAVVGTRRRLNLIEGSGVTLTVADDSTDEEVDVTIAATGGGGGAFIATDTIWNAKGDLAAGTGADTAAVVTAGSDGQVLTADSSESAGVRWATLATDGWIDDSANTWTYASASTFTVSGDRTAVFQKGTKLKFTQTTVKYAVVASSSHSSGTTTVTIIVNTDYTIANAAMDANAYTYVENPQGFPDWFTYTATLTGFSGTPTQACRYSVKGRTVFVKLSVSGTSNLGTFTISLPVAASTDIANQTLEIVRIVNNGANTNTGYWRIQSAATVCEVFRDAIDTAFTGSGTKATQGQSFYTM